MPVCAVVAIIYAVNLDLPAIWIVALALSGLVFVVGGPLPRIVWFPINLSVAGLYLGQISRMAIFG